MTDSPVADELCHRSGTMRPVRYPGDVSGASEALRALLGRIDDGVDAGFVHDLVTMAQLGAPVILDVASAEAAVRPYVWLLDRLRGGGITLTSAGYLPPAIVEETMTLLDPGGRWIGKKNRESLTPQVLDFRESAQQMGLVRKYRGQLLRTRTGERLAHDPLGLWWHIASRLPDARSDVESDAGVLLLLAIASGMPLDWRSEVLVVHRGLLCAGWRIALRGPLDEDGWAFWHAARPTRRVLQHVGAAPDRVSEHGPTAPSPSAVTFARAALRRPTP